MQQSLTLIVSLPSAPLRPASALLISGINVSTVLGLILSRQIRQAPHDPAFLTFVQKIAWLRHLVRDMIPGRRRGRRGCRSLAFLPLGCVDETLDIKPHRSGR